MKPITKTKCNVVIEFHGNRNQCKDMVYYWVAEFKDAGCYRIVSAKDYKGKQTCINNWKKFALMNCILDYEIEE